MIEKISREKKNFQVYLKRSKFYLHLEQSTSFGTLFGTFFLLRLTYSSPDCRNFFTILRVHISGTALRRRFLGCAAEFSSTTTRSGSSTGSSSAEFVYYTEEEDD